jgi:hypothetical protein
MTARQRSELRVCLGRALSFAAPACLCLIWAQACSSASRPGGIDTESPNGGASAGSGAASAAGKSSSMGGKGGSTTVQNGSQAAEAGSAGVDTEGEVAGQSGVGGAAGANDTNGGNSESAGTGGSSGTGPSGAGGGPVVPPSLCNPASVWIDGEPLSISTAVDDFFGSVTPDELSMAFTTTVNGMVQIEYADRASISDAFGAQRSLSGAFAMDRAALSPDGLELVLVNDDRRSFSEYTRSARADDFSAPGLGSFAAFEDYSQTAMPAANAFADPLLAPDDKTFIYSEYGPGVVETIHQTKRLFSGDSWSLGLSFMAVELTASGTQRRKPTGLSSDARTLFFWDEPMAEERAGFFVYQSDALSNVVDLGQRQGAQPNQACTRLYHSAAGVSSIDLFIARTE